MSEIRPKLKENLGKAYKANLMTIWEITLYENSLKLYFNSDYLNLYIIANNQNLTWFDRSVTILTYAYAHGK